MISGIGNEYNTQNIASLYNSRGVSSSGTSGDQSSSPQSYAGPDYVNRIGEKRESDKSALYAYENAKKQYESEQNRAGLEDKANAENKSATESKANADATTDLTPEEEKAVNELKQRDREVRAHEQQHVAAGGGHAGSPNYTFERGPDNRQYAVGGSVSIDVSPVAGDPEATIRKAETIRKAALAPSEPSAQDKSVAANASAMATEARIELQKEDQEGIQNGLGSTEATGHVGNAEATDHELGNTKATDNAQENNTSSQMQAYANAGSNLGQAKENSSEGYLNASSMEKKPRADVVASIYQNAQNMNSTLGAVVPWGTNINRVI